MHYVFNWYSKKYNIIVIIIVIIIIIITNVITSIVLSNCFKLIVYTNTRQWNSLYSVLLDILRIFSEGKIDIITTKHNSCTEQQCWAQLPSNRVAKTFSNLAQKGWRADACQLFRCQWQPANQRR